MALSCPLVQHPTALKTLKMAFSLRVFFLLCGISGLMTGAWSRPSKEVCCPEGWTQLDDHCYIFQADERMFLDAESVCNILGGNLASITSAVKNAVVQDLVNDGDADTAWIGLSDAIDAGTFIWTDGKPFGFSDFPSVLPTDVCVVIDADATTESWEGEACDSLEPYVCIRDACCDHHN
ncbi:type-2 ice-structuring protein-like [Nerophis lumbriciformis]|uniref:type-2 ice-structuring protein-like n=1 Tax=Nerophis lumbriciformis TaxID=546530 RepID=UPI002ADFB701|nr:type-2 ice-structuring protein-like [Nerophis lumbriciformis]